VDRLTSLSAFFPDYNEEGNVERMCRSLRAVLAQVAEDYEIIVVNDDIYFSIAEMAAARGYIDNAVEEYINFFYSSPRFSTSELVKAKEFIAQHKQYRI
jgi:TPR repeat protein